MIYTRVDGRIGNQLFIYAYAKSLSKELGDEDIVIDDTEVVKRNYDNSLVDYNLPNVRYVHNHKIWKSPKYWKQSLIFLLYRVLRKKMSFNSRYEMEKRMQPFFNKNGLFLCGMGYVPHSFHKGQDIFLNGYFQCDKYFENVSKDLIREFSLADNDQVKTYPGIDLIRNRNSVCISIKVQHNVGNSKFDVCNDGYWEEAIKYICDHVDNPLFFICSDNVEYVKENLIDCEKYDAIFQASNYPVSVSLAVMGNCKHFVIGNTTFGWWAQYLSEYPEKIVVAPSRWLNIDMPIDIYQDGWHLVEV